MHSLEVSEAFETEWRELHDQSLNGSVFTTWDFREQVDRGAKLILGKSSGKCVLGAWLCEKPYPFSKYVGIISVFKKESIRENVQLTVEFLRHLASFRREFTLQISQDEVTNLAVERATLAGHFTTETKIEFVGTIAKKQALSREGLSRDRRAELRRDADILISNDLSEHEMYGLLEQTFSRQRLDLLPSTAEYLRRYFRYSRTAGRINCVRSEGRAMAGTLFLAGNNRAHYVIGAASDAARTRGYMTRLIQDQIDYYCLTGTSEVDLMNVADTGRGDFKMSFGAEIRHIVRARMKANL